MVGLTRIELVTSSLSGTRSNQLSYKPTFGRDTEQTCLRETIDCNRSCDRMFHHWPFGLSP